MKVKKLSVIGLASALLFAADPSRANIETLEKTGSAFQQIAKSALPAVVFIDVETTVEVPQRGYYYNPLEQFFGRGNAPRMQAAPQTYQQEGQGSGFIISKDGYILTNNHVVNGADRITVTTAEGKEYSAKLIGTDPKTEVALIKIDGESDLPVVPLGDSDEIGVGEWVLAAGNPFGLSQTITAGIVSAKGRSGMGITEYENFIQTDAAINPGNSGGPMLNIRGEAIGINTAIYSRTGGYMGVGFAVPINMAKNIKDQLLKTGKVSRSVIGIIFQELDENLAKSFGLDDADGVLISKVFEDSAADKAGIQQGDIIVELNGEPIEKGTDLRNRVAAMIPGSKATLNVFRDGNYQMITAITESLDGENYAGSGDSEAFKKLGIAIDDLTDEVAKQLGHDNHRGVLITDVERGSPAWRAGLKPGQLILSVNRIAVKNAAAFKEILAEQESLDAVLLLIMDDRGSRFVVISAE